VTLGRDRNRSRLRKSDDKPRLFPVEDLAKVCRAHLMWRNQNGSSWPTQKSLLESQNEELRNPQDSSILMKEIKFLFFVERFRLKGVRLEIVNRAISVHILFNHFESAPFCQISDKVTCCFKRIEAQVSGVRILHPGFFFGEVFLAFEVEAGAHFGEP